MITQPKLNGRLKSNNAYILMTAIRFVPINVKQKYENC
jgi:hypothetical protein